jgi:hypothetical protein
MKKTLALLVVIILKISILGKHPTRLEQIGCLCFTRSLLRTIPFRLPERPPIGSNTPAIAIYPSSKGNVCGLE